MNKINFSKGSLLYPIIAGVLLFLVGVFVSGFYELYYKLSYLDIIYHFLGGIVLGWFFYILIFSKREVGQGDEQSERFAGKNFSVSMQLFILVSAVCFAGVIWEYAERLSTIYASIHAPWLYYWFSGGNLNDTLFDLLADMFGGAFFFGIRKSMHKVRYILHSLIKESDEN
ncbi:MAG: hypothetical protein AAB726_01745, partial [Patescibacteria group bacterium]